MHDGNMQPKSSGPVQALQDIEFIKHLVAKNNEKLDQGFPYLYIWGCYLMIGYIGMYFADTVSHNWSSWYWPIAGGVGGILSFLVGIGVVSFGNTCNVGVQRGGSYGWMFWFPFLAVGVSGYFMMLTDIVRIEYAGIFWFTLAGILYVSLGALLGRGPVILGIWFIILSAATRLFLIDYQFLILGVLGGGSIIVVGGLLHWRRGRHG